MYVQCVPMIYITMITVKVEMFTWNLILLILRFLKNQEI